MAQTALRRAQTAYDEIVSHIEKSGSGFSSWYVGITKNIRDRLFDDHKVPREAHWYIYRRTATVLAARRVEGALLELGCDGGAGGGGDDAIYVYAYLKKSPITRP